MVKGRKYMINYSLFWETLKNSEETTYSLIKKHGIPSATLNKLRHNKPVNLTSLNELCGILNCNIEDLVTITKDDAEKFF